MKEGNLPARNPHDLQTRGGKGKKAGRGKKGRRGAIGKVMKKRGRTLATAHKPPFWGRHAKTAEMAWRGGGGGGWVSVFLPQSKSWSCRWEKGWEKCRIRENTHVKGGVSFRPF